MQQHGIKRKPRNIAAEEKRKADEAPLIQQYRDLCAELYRLNATKDYDQRHLPLTWQLLTLNPEMPTAWAYRRRILLNISNQNPQDKQQLLLQDLHLTLQALKQNPKAYPTWEHRKWLLTQLPQPQWQGEYALIAKFLEADARNFHGWGYRRYVVAAAPTHTTPDREFQFTTSKIEASFSNYSAWHYRSKLIAPRLDQLSSDGKRNLLDQEFEFVRKALYTDPADQSGWLYHRLLVGLYESDGLIDLLEREIESIQELAECEADTPINLRWPLNALVHYHGLLARRVPDQERSTQLITAAIGMCQQLKQLDQDRQARYAHLETALQGQLAGGDGL